MYDHQRIARSPVTELLQQLVKDIIVALHECVGFGEQVLEQSHPLREIDQFIDISTMDKSLYGISGSHNMLE